MKNSHRQGSLFISFIFIISISLLSGCASSQPQASPEQIQAIMGAIGGKAPQQPTRPVIDFSTQPKIALNTINNDSFGLTDSLYSRFEEMGIQIVSDRQEADVVLSGTVKYVGDPDDRPSQFNSIRKQAQVTGAATSAARLSMGMANPFELASSGAGLLASAVSKAVEPNRIQGIVVLHVRQGDRMWDVDLDHTVEVPKQDSERALATEMSHSILSKLGG